MSIKENEAIARRFEEAANTGNTADAADYIAPGFRQHGPGTPETGTGPQGFKDLINAYRTAFPDLHLTIDDMVVGEDKVAVRYRGRGTHRGEFEGIAPTGRQFETTGVDIVHIANGKITEAWQVVDSLAFWQGIGVAHLSPEAQGVR